MQSCRAVAPRCSSGHHGPAGRSANRSPRVRSIKANPVGCRRFEVGGLPFKVGVVVVADLSPAPVIGHDEDDVGLAGGFR